ncbi:MAG TPA: tagaturonate epimerase family protein [Lacipirellula sp.]
MTPQGTFVSAGGAKARLKPSPLGLAPSFGFGDRLGLATPGHLAALRDAGGPIRGVFAQQSIREMLRTRRGPHDVMQAAVVSLEDAEFTDKWSADADHLKTPEDVRRAMEAGFVLFTLDPSDEVDQAADTYDADVIDAKFAEVKAVAPWVEQYRGKAIRLSDVVIEFDELTLKRAAVKYARAMRRAIFLGQAVRDEGARLKQPFEIELSIDETAEPTTPAEHYIFVEQLREVGITLVSLAPRLVGDFEKGVDFKGDLKELEKSLRIHAEIAERLGPYKLSLHSGSDKLSMYPILARVTKGQFHVKTAGTSYLEALRVAAQYDPAFFREIIDFSRRHFDRDKATYHVSATLRTVPAPDDIDDPADLEQLYLERWDGVPEDHGFTQAGRQILHCTFGSVITDAKLGPALVALLRDRTFEYCDILREHFVRHLNALRMS